MDLLGTLKQEITELKLVDKRKIAQYIYKRTGELFEYDPLWIFSNEGDRDYLRDKKIDIRNVTDFDITCFSWADLYNELLHEFAIVSRVKYITDEVSNAEKDAEQKPSHAYVEVIIDGRVYLADLTASYNDMIGIRYGLGTKYNCQLSKNFYSKEYEFDSVGEDIDQKNLDIEELVSSLKNELVAMEKNTSSREEYIYYVYLYISQLINVVEVKTGYVIGAKYIQALLKMFLGEDYLMQNIYFYNKDKSVYIAVHQIPIGSNLYYFAYEKTSSNTYEMHEASQEQIDTYYELYSYKYSKDLKGAVINTTKWK